MHDVLYIVRSNRKGISIVHDDICKKCCTSQETDDHHDGTRQITYHKNPRWRQPLYLLSKNVNIFGADYGQLYCKIVFSLHVVESVSDDYNF